MGLGCSVQGVQEAAAAESSPARSQGSLTPAVILLPFLFHHVHWERSRGRGERDSVRGIPAAASHAGSTEHTLERSAGCPPASPDSWLHQGGSHAHLAHCSTPAPVSGTGFLEGVNEGDICSAAVRPVSCYLPFPKLSMKTQVSTLLDAPPVNQFAVSPALQPDGAQAESFIHYLI